MPMQASFPNDGPPLAIAWYLVARLCQSCADARVSGDEPDQAKEDERPMKSRIFAQSMLIGAAAAAVLLGPTSARACGGLFCSSPNLPVNQAAEKIIFATNADNTVTAVIQIAYQGPAQKFSWLLPLSSVPKMGQIGVASNLAFQRLQTATNPQYTLTTRVEGTCENDFARGANPTSVGASAGGA